MIDPYVVDVMVRARLADARAEAERDALANAAPRASRAPHRDLRTVAGVTLIRLGAWLLRSSPVDHAPRVVASR